VRRLAGVLAVVAGAPLVIGGCTGAAPTASPLAAASHPSGASRLVTAAVPTLSVAERHATDTGAVPASTPVTLTLVLRRRNQDALAALLDSGRTVTPAQWASSYGPDPTATAVVAATLRAAGMVPSWSPGDTLMTATGTAASVERLFHVSIDGFVAPHGGRFYGPTEPLAPPRSLAGAVVAATGATDYRQPRLAATTRSSNGLSPTDAANFYDITPLRQAGLDGTGVTVMFPEWAMPDNSVLDAYASKFNLPGFNVTVHQEFGSPKSSTGVDASEAAMDLEIVHGLAPGAKEVVYEIGDPNRLPDAIQMMISQNPHSVLSSSIGSGPGCEAEAGDTAYAQAMDSVFAPAAAEGTSIFWASGDSGAYGCVPDGNQSTESVVSVDGDGTDSPNATAVGGTSVFQTNTNGYGKEAAWGEPFEQAGSGGGVSTVFSQPPYQQAPDVAAGSLRGRGVPDVSCDADPIVGGWDVFNPTSNGPQEGGGGGTSAAAPCWAAITALVDEDLAHLGLPMVGFANPALYDFSRDPAGLPGPPFHAVTEGSNLHYLATTGWNAATGLGTPDAARLADDFGWYEKQSR
jgi:subtilase family serine protease